MTGHDDTALLKALGCLVFGGAIAYAVFGPATSPGAAPVAQAEQIASPAPIRDDPPAAPALPNNGSAVLVTHSVVGTSVSSPYLPSPPQPEYLPPPTPVPAYAGDPGNGEPRKGDEALLGSRQTNGAREAGVFVGVAATHALRGELRAGRQFERAEQRAARFEDHLQHREMRVEHREERRQPHVERPVPPVHVSGGAAVGYHPTGGGGRRR